MAFHRIARAFVRTDARDNAARRCNAMGAIIRELIFIKDTRVHSYPRGLPKKILKQLYVNMLRFFGSFGFL